MLHKHLFVTSAFVAAAVIITGCSSVDPENQEVYVSSTPSDATVSINGKVMSSTTNTSFELPRKDDYVIVVTKAGYIPATVQIQPLPTGAEAEGLPRFQLSSTNIKVTLDEDPFAAFEALEGAADSFAEVEAVTAAAPAVAAPVDTAKLNRIAEEKLARENAEKRAAAEAKQAAATNAAAAKQAAADLAAEEALAIAAAEADVAKAAAAKVAAENAAAKQAAAAASATASAEASRQAALEAELKAANEKIARLEQAKARPAAPAVAPAAPAATDILARYKTLREQLKSGEITQAEYNASVAKLKR